MKILLVGAGGVGGAFAAIAARRDFFEAIVVADYDQAKAERAAATDERYVAAQIDASVGRVGRGAVPRARHHPRDERGRPGLQHVDLQRRVRRRRRLPRHGDVAVEAAPGGAVRADRREARRRAVRASPHDWEAAGPAGAGRHRRRAGPVRRLRALRRRPPLQRDRRARHPRRRQPGRHRRRRQRDLRAVVLDVDHDRGVPQPAGDLGEGAAAGSRPRRSPSPRSSTSPRASGRSSASTSSTRRCS